MNTLSFPVLALGTALPRNVVTNAQLAAQLAQKGIETSDDWITSRTGITQRYLVSEDEGTFSLALAAANQALERAGVNPQQLTAIVVATCTPEKTFPSTATLVHGALGAGPSCFALDVNLACTGFIGALTVARNYLAGQGKANQNQYALVIGAETFSRLLDWSDRATCVLFGDGAGALLLGVEESTGETTGLLATEVGTDGAQAHNLQTTGGAGGTGTTGHVSMNGREVFKHAVRRMGSVPPILSTCGLTLEDIDLVVPHQANKRILEAAAENLGLPEGKMMITVDKHANTSAASIPLALGEALATGRLHKGDTILLQAFGAGFTWGEAVIKW